MRVIRLEVGPMPTNAYLVRAEEGGAGVVIDPGADAGRIIQRCRDEGLTPVYIINTHAHTDHIGANAALKREFPDAQLCMGALAADRIGDPVDNLSAAFGTVSGSPPADVRLRDGQELQFGSVVLEVLHTPGHTPGAICLLARREDPPQLFCGDLVFRRGVGRTDLPGGDPAALRRSIRDKVLVLPDETVILPGHEEVTTVGEERRENPFMAAL